MAVTGPIGNAKDWLEMAEMASKRGKPAQSIYAMEMAVEIALKSVLIAVHVDVPKVHDIRKTVKTFLAGNRLVERGFLKNIDGYLATFETLLRLRSPAGYGFESAGARGEINAEAKELLPKCSEIVSACGHVIEQISGQDERG